MLNFSVGARVDPALVCRTAAAARRRCCRHSRIGPRALGKPVRDRSRSGEFGRLRLPRRSVMSARLRPTCGRAARNVFHLGGDHLVTADARRRSVDRRPWDAVPLSSSGTGVGVGAAELAESELAGSGCESGLLRAPAAAPMPPVTDDRGGRNGDDARAVQRADGH